MSGFLEAQQNNVGFGADIIFGFLGFWNRKFVRALPRNIRPLLVAPQLLLTLTVILHSNKPIEQLLLSTSGSDGWSVRLVTKSFKVQSSSSSWNFLRNRQVLKHNQTFKRSFKINSTKRVESEEASRLGYFWTVLVTNSPSKVALSLYDY